MNRTVFQGNADRLIKKNNRIFIVSILLVTFIVYVRVFYNQFTNWDDEEYILKNQYLAINLKNFLYLATHSFMGNYHPVTMLVYSLAHAIGGLNPWIYQLANLALHLSNTFLVYIFIHRLLNQAFPKETHLQVIPLVTSVLFGVHTLQTESVAWVSELKTLLYTFFFLCALVQYLKYKESSNQRFLVFSIAFFLFSVLAKAMAVPLLFTLFLVDHLLHQKLLARKNLIEKIPFLIIGLGFGYIAILAQGEAITVVNSFAERIAFGSYGFIMYLMKAILPVNLSCFYAYPIPINNHIPYYFYAFPAIVLTFLLFLFVYFRKNSKFIFGIGFFLVNIVLVLQLLPVGSAIMADRYFYVPSIGLFFLVGSLMAGIVKKYQKRRFWVWLFFTTYLVCLSVMTFNRVSIWKDSITLWNDAIKKTAGTDNAVCYFGRGAAYNAQKNYPKALRDFDKAISILPDYPEALFNRAMVKIDMQLHAEAITDLNQAIKLDPKDLEATELRGLARVVTQDYENAIPDLDASIRHKTKDPEVYSGRGYIYLLSGDYSNALVNYNKAIQLKPNNFYYRKFRGVSKVKLGLYGEAIADLDYALGLMQDPYTFYFRGYAKFMLGFKEEGCEDIRIALENGYTQSDSSFEVACAQ